MVRGLHGVSRGRKPRRIPGTLAWGNRYARGVRWRWVGALESPPLQPLMPPQVLSLSGPTLSPSLFRPHQTHRPLRRAQAWAAAAAAATHLRREDSEVAAASAPAVGAARARTHRGKEQRSRTRAWRGSAWTCGRARRERGSPGTPRLLAPWKRETAGEPGHGRSNSPRQAVPHWTGAGDARTHRQGRTSRTTLVPHLRGIRPAAPECGKHGSAAAIKTGGAHEHYAGGTGGGWEWSGSLCPQPPLAGRWPASSALSLLTAPRGGRRVGASPAVWGSPEEA